MVIVILGPQGSGKDTQADLLSKKLNIPMVSIGKVLRELYEKGTKEGIEAKEKYWGKGNLVSDELMSKILIFHLRSLDTSSGLILEGYPRNVGQLGVLGDILKSSGVGKVDKVFMLNISKEESVRRLKKRAKNKGRMDDTPELIETRLEVYKEETEPMVEKFRQKGIVEEINGEGPIREIHEDILERLGLS